METKLFFVVVTLLALQPADSAPSTSRPKTKSTIGKDPEEYLDRFGYLRKSRPGEMQRLEDRVAAIKKFQKTAGLPQTGVLDEATKRKMTESRCGMPDGPGQSRQMIRKQRATSAWTSRNLSYRVQNFSPDLPSSQQTSAFRSAFSLWSQVAQIDFQKTDASNADIVISFASNEHGDGEGNSFDGKGGVLAHAYFPQDGDAHFDDDEIWVEGGSETGTNLHIVAAHEFGHSIGLEHSQNPDALMAPYYKYVANLVLHQDDISAVQALYGRRRGGPAITSTTRQSITSTTRRPITSTTRRNPFTTTTTAHTPHATPPNACTTKWDAALKGPDGMIYVFRSNWTWVLGNNGVQPGYPKLTSTIFDHAPSHINAAVYSERSKKIYLFGAHKVYVYEGSRPIYRRITTKYITDSHYPVSPDAAFIHRDGRIYLFKGSRYYLFDEDTVDMDHLYRNPYHIRDLWPGIPDHIDSAIKTEPGYMYFFKDDVYYKYNEVTRTVVSGYPKPKAGPWMGPQCSGGKVIPK